MLDKDEDKINHVAIIMDGNGRWAKEHGKDRKHGHKAGAQNLIDIAELCIKNNINYLTVYAFSTENWNRPQDEKKYLFTLLEEFYKKEIKRLVKNNIKISHIGDISKFPKKTYNIIRETEEQTRQYLIGKDISLTITIALNYGSRDELSRSIKNICLDFSKGAITDQDIDEQLISRYLDTNGIPDPDLLIRTSGEYRLSNFLLYQIAYTELYFTDVYWPDFSEKEFIEAIENYKKRKRRFGGL